MAKYRITLQLEPLTKVVEAKATVASTAKEAAARRAWVEALDIKTALLIEGGWDIFALPLQEVEAVDD